MHIYIYRCAQASFTFAEKQAYTHRGRHCSSQRRHRILFASNIAERFWRGATASNGASAAARGLLHVGGYHATALLGAVMRLKPPTTHRMRARTT